MPSWWGKSSSKDSKKKNNKESFIDTLHRRFKTNTEEKVNTRAGGSRSRRHSDIVSEKGSLSRAISRSPSPSPSSKVSRCQSFADRGKAQPLPLPGVHPSSVGRTDSALGVQKPALEKRAKPSSLFALPKPGLSSVRADPTDVDADLQAVSVSSDCSTDSDDPADSRHLSPRAADLENGSRTVASSPTSTLHKEQSPVVIRKNLRELRPVNLSFNTQSLSTSPRRGPLSAYAPTLQIPQNGAFTSAPDSSMSSPSRSPMRGFSPEQIASSAFWAAKPYPDVPVLGSGHCSSPGSGQNSGHNSMGGDMCGQLFWQQSRGSAECSPIPSPRMTSPGPSSRIHSGAVTPLHPRAGGASTETSANWPDDMKQQSHRLPLPPSNSSHFSPTNSTAATSPSVPRSPGRAENPTSPGSRWKKGRLLGRGTFGHVYVGFNSESGEMCAMKEVTLFDDAKSRESAKQLGQEITLLSRLRHPNIVQYYGTETVDDKLYIYLEYVSGGSIYKLLQDYGQFGELAIRSYTQQILSGLAYLHAKNTVHRDIKGANILVDPNGRVKLADFGMAKHITGQSCPLSFKGSPYWMAPEVIKNSNGANLAVDIWSLGCTVLEMATTKPPWSQYEGVAAMFKIGNSKELPAIPDTLSEEGKEFVRLCLQRNPIHRPTAAQLLEHAFVKDAAPLERPILGGVEPLESLPGVTTGLRSLGVAHARNLSSLDSEGPGNHFPRGVKSGPTSSDGFMPRNISCPVSPIGSPHLHSRSPQHRNGRMSPSPISSPHTMSGSSTPLTGGNGAIPFHHLKHPAYLVEGFTNTRVSNGFYGNNGPPDLFRAMQPGNHVFRPAHGEVYDGQSVLADRVSQQLLRDHVKSNPSLDLTPGSPILGRTNGV